MNVLPQTFIDSLTNVRFGPAWGELSVGDAASPDE